MSQIQSMLKTYTTFEEFAADFLARINKSSYWSDSQVSSMTSLLADMLADIGVTNQYATVIAAREAFIRLARRETSVLECCRFLGVKINRKSCPMVTARILNNSDKRVTLPKHSQFTIGDKRGLTTQPYVWEKGETKDIDLKIGFIVEQSRLLGIVPDYFRYTTDIQDFAATDEMEVWTEDGTGTRQYFQRYDGQLFKAGVGSPIYIDTTMSDGSVQLTFGSDQFGLRPQNGSMLKLRIVCTDGASSNLEVAGIETRSSTEASLQGRTTTFITGGSDPKELEYYRTFAPTRARTDKLVTKSEWRAASMLYPDVADCVIQNQADIAPNDRQWQGVIRVCVLPKSTSTWGGTNPDPESAQWTKFITYMKQYGSQLEIQKWNPTKLPVDVRITVQMHRESEETIQSVKDLVSNSVMALTARDLGSLGKRLSLSNINEAVLFDMDDPDQPVRRNFIDFCTIESPTTDVVPRSVLEHVTIRNLIVQVVFTENRR